MLTFDIESEGLLQVGMGWCGGWWGVWGDLVEGSEVVAETAGGGKRMWSHSPRKEASHCGPESKSES